ncbi:MAG: GNVR domain-containing protein, partial [Calditrichota bacterium]
SRDITLPQFQVDRIRAQRKLELQTAIYVEMRKQMELVKLDNYLRLTPIKVLDEAFPPWRKSRPKRALLLISIGLLLGLVQLGINYLFYLYPQVKRSINSEA